MYTELKEWVLYAIPEKLKMDKEIIPVFQKTIELLIEEEEMESVRDEEDRVLSHECFSDIRKRAMIAVPIFGLMLCGLDSLTLQLAYDHIVDVVTYHLMAHRMEYHSEDYIEKMELLKKGMTPEEIGLKGWWSP